LRERRRFFVANWKMSRTPSAAAELARAIAALALPAEVDIAIAPSFPALDRVRAALKVTHVEQFFRFFDDVASAEQAIAS